MFSPSEAPSHRGRNSNHDDKLAHPLSAMVTTQFDPSAVLNTPRVRRFSAKLADVAKNSPRFRSVSPTSASSTDVTNYSDNGSLNPADAQETTSLFPSIILTPTNDSPLPELRYKLRSRTSSKRRLPSSSSPVAARGPHITAKAKRRRLNCHAASDDGAESNSQSKPNRRRRAHVVLGTPSGVKFTARHRKDRVAERLCKLAQQCENELDLSQLSVLPLPLQTSYNTSPPVIMIDNEENDYTPNTTMEPMALNTMTPMDILPMHHEVPSNYPHYSIAPPTQQHTDQLNRFDSDPILRDDDELELDSCGAQSTDDESDDNSSIKLAQASPMLNSYFSKVVGQVSRYILG